MAGKLGRIKRPSLKTRWTAGGVLAALAALLVAVPALAGGWAVTTVDELPRQVVAGQPVTIGFTVRQHGRQPLANLSPAIAARHKDSGQLVKSAASAQGPAGHYVATLLLPVAGTWEWTIHDGFFTSETSDFPGQPLPPLTVVLEAEAGAPLGPSPVALPEPLQLPLVAGLLGAAGAAAGMVLLRRKQAPAAAALVLGSVLVAALGFTLPPGSEQASAAASSPLATDADYGRALFLAKGCVMCHMHQAVRAERRQLGDFSVGPDLSRYSASPDHLRAWLKDPASIKPLTEMPDLGLKQEEIEALIAFLNLSAGQ